MKLIRVSDELYDQLKTFVVDPFDDTPEIVIGRLADIVNKAKTRWSPLEHQDTSENVESAQQTDSEPLGVHHEPVQNSDERVVAL